MFCSIFYRYRGSGFVGSIGCIVRLKNKACLIDRLYASMPLRTGLGAPVLRNAVKRNLSFWREFSSQLVLN